MKRALFLAAMVFAGFAFAHGGGGGGGGCGGHGGCGLDSDSDPFAPLPGVKQTLKFGGLSLEVDRTKFGILTAPSGVPVSFPGEDTSIKVFTISNPSKDLSKQALAMGSPADVTVKVSPFMTDYGIHGVIATYGMPPTLFNQHIHAVRYLLWNPKGGVLCFEVTAHKPYPDWRDSKALVNSLSAT